MKFNLSSKLTLSVIVILAPILLFSPSVRSANNPLEERQMLENSGDDNNKAMKLIVIDPGHGGKIPGARGRIAAEKDIVLQVTKKLKEAIEKEMPGVTAMLTRDTDVDVPFHERTAL